ncbi:hypothetical protein CEXT_198911, partial [Caerostris extrusa]
VFSRMVLPAACYNILGGSEYNCSPRNYSVLLVERELQTSDADSNCEF